MDKYLKVMADYSSSGLWRRDGVNVYEHAYGLSSNTLLTLAEWCNWYESNDSYLGELDRKDPPFDLKSFSERGLEVARMIKEELPDWEIVYFDEHMMMALMDDTCGRRDVYEYSV